MIKDSVQVSIWKEVIMDYFQVLSCHTPAQIEETWEKPELGEK
jgi:hypothetical protein